VNKKGNKKTNRKGRKGKKRKITKKAIKEEEPNKIKIMLHELLASTLSYLMLTPW
jgi:hypothetical protein